MRKTLTILAIVLLSVKARADFSIGYLPVNRSMLQATTNPEKFLFGDIRLQTNSFISNSNIEIAPFLNIRKRETVNIYWGIGVSINPFNAYSNSSLLNGYFTTA